MLLNTMFQGPQPTASAYTQDVLSTHLHDTFKKGPMAQSYKYSTLCSFVPCLCVVNRTENRDDRKGRKVSVFNCTNFNTKKEKNTMQILYTTDMDIPLFCMSREYN